MFEHLQEIKYIQILKLQHLQPEFLKPSLIPCCNRLQHLWRDPEAIHWALANRLPIRFRDLLVRRFPRIEENVPITGAVDATGRICMGIERRSGHHFPQCQECANEFSRSESIQHAMTTCEWNTLP